MSENQWTQTTKQIQYLDYILPRDWRNIRKHLDRIHQQYIKDYRDNKQKNITKNPLKNVVVEQNIQKQQYQAFYQQEKLRLVEKRQSISQKNTDENKYQNVKNSQSVQKTSVDFQDNDDKLKNQSYSQNEKSRSEKDKKKNGLTIEARNRKCWPEISVYLQTVKINLTFRQIYDISSDILVIPFKTTKFEYYPGNILKGYFDNHQNVLMQAKIGSVNIVSIKEIVHFRYVAFFKMEESQIDKSLELGLQSLLSLLVLNKNKHIQSVVFPLNQKISKINTILDVLSKNCTIAKIKQLEIYFFCRELLEFQKGCSTFNSYLNQQTL